MKHKTFLQRITTKEVIFSDNFNFGTKEWAESVASDLRVAGLKSALAENTPLGAWAVSADTSQLISCDNIGMYVYPIKLVKAE